MPKTAVMLCGLRIFVEQAAEPVSASDTDALGCQRRQRSQWRGVVERSMGPMLVMVLDVFAQRGLQLSSAQDQHPVQQLAT